MARFQEHVKRLHAGFGPQRLMWGTDWPVSKKDTDYAHTLSVVRDDMRFLNAEDKSWMLSKTSREDLAISGLVTKVTALSLSLFHDDVRGEEQRQNSQSHFSRLELRTTCL